MFISRHADPHKHTITIYFKTLNSLNYKRKRKKALNLRKRVSTAEGWRGREKKKGNE